MSGTGGRSDDARSALLTRLEPPQWFGEISVFDGNVRSHDAVAAEPCTLLHVPNEPLQEWLRGHPEHWHALALLVTDKLRTAFIGTDNYQFGVELAKKVVELKPKGGTLCIQSGTAGSLNLDLRVQGVREIEAGPVRLAPGRPASGNHSPARAPA